MPAAGCCPRSTTSSVCTPVAAWPLPAPATPPPTRPSACPTPLCTGSSPTVSSRHLGSLGAQSLGALPTSAALAGGEISVTTEPLLLVADLLYALGWSLWTGVVVVFLVQIWPEAKPATPWLEVIALVALVIPFLGWVVGVVLVSLSRLWTTGDKLIATLGGLSWVVAELGGLSIAGGSTAWGRGRW